MAVRATVTSLIASAAATAWIPAGSGVVMSSFALQAAVSHLPGDTSRIDRIGVRLDPAEWV
jgi:hypothetical protein